MLRNQRWHGLISQVFLLAVFGLLIFTAANNAYENLQHQHIATGWDFLNVTSGFALSLTLIDYSETSTYGRAFVAGLLNTLLVAALGVILATLVGFIAGIARLSSNWLIAKLALCYVELVRNVPLVLQLMFWYRAVLVPLPPPRQSLNFADIIFLNNRGLIVPQPVFGEHADWILWGLMAGIALSIVLYFLSCRRRDITGCSLPVVRITLLLIIGLPLAAYFLAGQPVGWSVPELQGFNFRGGGHIIPEFVALLAGLTIYTAAFIAEIVRAGIQAVPAGQGEAAYALGLPRSLTLRFVVVPQALRIIVPPLTSQYLNLIKNSSLAVAIGYPDFFTVAGTINNQTGQAVEVIAITMAVYLLLSLLTSAFMNWYNSRLELAER